MTKQSNPSGGPTRSVNNIVKQLKGRTSRIPQQAFSRLRKPYRGKYFWAIGYGAWSLGEGTDELITEYVQHHRHPSNQDTDPLILEEIQRPILHKLLP